MPKQFEEFVEIAVTRLANENVNKSLSVTIAERVWNERGSRDVRDVVKVGRLSNSIEDVSFVVRMMKRQFLDLVA